MAPSSGPDARAVVAACASRANIFAAIKSAGLVDLLGRTLKGRQRPRILLLVDLAMWRPGDPNILSARAVEDVIDMLVAEVDAEIMLGASADESAAWAPNREVHALAELAGYRYEADGGHGYDILDLSDETIEGGFPEGSVLAGTPASRAWAEADLRIVLARPRLHPADGFAGALETLLGALPLRDKQRAYRLARSAGDVVSALLATMPPDFVLLDGSDEGDGNAGFVIASPSPLLADFAAGLKLGLDPFMSPLVATVARDHPLPPRYEIAGDLAPLPARAAPGPILRRARQQSATSPLVAELSQPWLQALASELFPPNRPLDARLNALLADNGEGATRTLAELLLGGAGKAVSSYQCLFDKDALLRRVVPLDIDPATIDPEAYAHMREALDSLAPLAQSAPQRAPRLRWRRIDGAVVFAYQDELAIPFDTFVGAVEVANAIQYMNDYLGGLIVPVEQDPQDRPVRQVERNLYLPQPNYLVLYGGQPIDVTKIEAVVREPDLHRLYWQTLHSANGSASADDGTVTFERTALGTRITIMGKQAFTLPLFWQLFDIRLFPAIDEALTTDAYRTFFSRTIANFEALVESRDIAIGQDADQPHRPAALALEAMLGRLTDAATPWLERMQGGRPAGQLDANGFLHVAPAGAALPQ